jgi:hypothetical protein
MKMIVIIPMPSYSSLLSRCEISSPDYLLLKNGIVQSRQGVDEVSLLCDESQAKRILDFVARVAPEHASAIRQINLPPDV